MIPGKAIGSLKTMGKFYQHFLTKVVATMGSVSVWGFIVLVSIASTFMHGIMEHANTFLSSSLITGAEWSVLVKETTSTFFTLLGTMVSFLLALRKASEIIKSKKEGNND